MKIDSIDVYRNAFSPIEWRSDSSEIDTFLRKKQSLNAFAPISLTDDGIEISFKFDFLNDNSDIFFNFESFENVTDLRRSFWKQQLKSIQD